MTTAAPALGWDDLPPARRRRWWREVVIVGLFYGLYSAVRDIHGRKPVSVDTARANALVIVRAEQWLHVFAEQRVQAGFIHDRVLVSLLDDYYGTVHFLAVIAVLIVIYRWFPERYPLWRNTLAIATAAALVGFLVFPVMPPRLLPPSFKFVDTLQTIGGVWNFKAGPVDSISNQFAAMPSLHTAWSVWCALAVRPLIRPRWGRTAILAYPALTVFCIVVTGNHYFADAVGGAVAVAIGYGGARLLTGPVGLWRLHRMLSGELVAPR